MATRGCTSSAENWQSGTGMPNVMHGDPANIRLGAARLETTVQVPRLEWRTGPGREHQPALYPGSALRSLGGGLVLLADPQRRHERTALESSEDQSKLG